MYSKVREIFKVLNLGIITMLLYIKAKSVTIPLY